MKHIILSIFLSAALGASALSPEMEAFEKYCLGVSNGVELRDVAALEQLLDGYDEAEYAGTGAFSYGDVEFELGPMNRVTPISDDASIAPESILLFTPDYVDALLVSDFNPVEMLPPSLNRGAFGCSYYHLGIAPGKSAGISAMGTGEMEIFAVASPQGKIDMQITQAGEPNPIPVEKIQEGRGAQASWTINGNSDFSILITNLGTDPISVIIASN